MEANRALWAVVAVAMVGMLSLGGAMYAQRPGKLQIATSAELVRTIETQGTATINVKPDTAVVNVGLMTKADTAQAVTTQAAETLDKMLKTLDGLGIPRDKVKTMNYNLGPDYRYDQSGPHLLGYVVNSTLAVTLSPMNRYEQVGPLLDKLVASGANTIQGISFTLKDEEKVKQQALEQAVQDARERADALAAKLNVKVIGVKNVSANTPGAPPPRYLAMDRSAAMAVPAASPATPIQAGELEYRLTVDVDFLLG